VNRGFFAAVGTALLAILLAAFGLAPSFASGASVSGSAPTSASAPAGHSVSVKSGHAKKASKKAKKKSKAKHAKKHKVSVKARVATKKKVKKQQDKETNEPVKVAPVSSSPVITDPADPAPAITRDPVDSPTPIASPDPVEPPDSDVTPPPTDTPTSGDETTLPAPVGVQDVVQDRAMWLWNWDDNQSVLDFSLAHNVKEIFTYAFPGFMHDDALRTKLADLTSRGNALGIRMWAMGGDPSWVTSPQTALAWVAEVNSSGFFNGIHLEIEPHSEYGYWENQDARDQMYISLLDQVEAAKGDQTLELSLPWWYHTITYGESTLDVAAISAVDQITIVTFDDSVTGIQNDALNAAAIADAQNKPYRLASETNTVDTDWITFAGQSNTEMLTVQNAVSQTLLTKPNYLGFAVEDYTGWSALAP